MSRWFRHYAGMMRDEKLVRVAIRTKQTIERVVWVWGAILESAAEIDENGRFDVDAAEIAFFLRADESDIGSILAGLAGAGHLAEDCVVKWGDRQFQSDRSASRQAAYRERERAEKRNGDNNETSRDGQVTSPSRHRDAPETETETETDIPLANANGARPENSDSEFWSSAKAFLKPETSNPGGMVGKWCKSYPKVAVASAITAAQVERPAQRIPYIEAILRKQTAPEPAVPL